MAEVCRKHSVSPALVYRWRAVAHQASPLALQQVDSRGKSSPDAQRARLQAELERMRRVVAELTDSRYVVHHRPLTELNGRAVSVELEAAIATCGAVKLRIVHDHGSEFCNTDLRAVIKAHDLLDIRTRARPPESNGIVERVNGTVRRDSEDSYGTNYVQAERTVARLIDEYNNVRQHAALGYFEPRELHLSPPSIRR